MDLQQKFFMTNLMLVYLSTI